MLTTKYHLTHLFGKRIVPLVALAFVVHASMYAASPWETAVTNFGNFFTGPLARYGSLIGVVAAGLYLIFGEHGVGKKIAGAAAGICLVLGAASWIQWVYPAASFQ